MTVRTWSSRAAANSSVSASGPSSLPMPDRTRCRMISAPGEPPGSRVMIARSFAASRRSAKHLMCVDFPDPSPPSNVMKRPRPGIRLITCSAMSELIDAGAEHSDHKLARAIDGAAHGGPGTYRLRGVNRCLDHDIRAAPNLHHPDSLPGLDRRMHRAAIDHAGDQFLVGVLLHHHLDRFRADQLDRAAFAAEQPCVTERLLGRKQGSPLEIAISPFQHLFGFVGAVFLIFQAIDDHDQADAVLHG